MSDPRNYDSKQILQSFLGNILVDFAEDSFVTIAWDTESFTDKVGADGFVVRSRQSDNRATITIRLSQRSPSNAILFAAHKADRATGRGVGPYIIKDLGGQTLITAPNTWVQKRPDVEFGKDAGEMEWVLRTSNADGFIGGEIL